MKHLFIAYCLSNISAKNYQNQFMHLKVIARQSTDIFETRCIYLALVVPRFTTQSLA